MRERVLMHEHAAASPETTTTNLAGMEPLLDPVQLDSLRLAINFISREVRRVLRTCRVLPVEFTTSYARDTLPTPALALPLHIPNRLRS